jgi:hypothetical protein
LVGFRKLNPTYGKTTFHYPIYLEPDVEQFVTKIAEHKKIEVQFLVNEWLRNNIKLIQSVEQVRNRVS